MNQRGGQDSGSQPLDHAAHVLTAGDPDSKFSFGSSDAASEQFDLIPPFGTPRLLVPVNPRSRSAAIGLFAGRSVERLSHRAAVKIVPMLSMMSPRSRVELATSGPPSTLPIRSLISDVLDGDRFELVVRLGAARPNGKLVVAAVDEAGEALAFFKFGRQGFTDHLVRHESEVLRELNSVDLPVVVPRVIYSDTWSGLYVLGTQSIPARRLPDDASHPHRIADAIAGAFASSTTTLAESSYWERTAQRIVGAQASKAGPLLAAAIEYVTPRWGDWTVELTRGHGDWIRPNLGARGDCLVALDWERSESDLPRGLDNAHFALFDLVRSGRFWKRTNVERLNAETACALAHTDISVDHAPLLAILNLIEMVLRFAEAEIVGVHAQDRSYAPLLAQALDDTAAGRT